MFPVGASAARGGGGDDDGEVFEEREAARRGDHRIPRVAWGLRERAAVSVIRNARAMAHSALRVKLQVSSRSRHLRTVVIK